MEIPWRLVVLAFSQILFILPVVQSINEKPYYYHRRNRQYKRNGALPDNELVDLELSPRQRHFTQAAVGEENFVDTFPVWDSKQPWWLEILNFTGTHGSAVSSSTSVQVEEGDGSSSTNSGSLPQGGDEEMGDDSFDLGRTLGAERPQSASKYITKSKSKNRSKTKSKNKKKKKSKNYAKPYIPLKAPHKNTILQLHNRFRQDAFGPASNMEELHWDERLERMSRQYAKQCRWEHGQVSNESPWQHVGQNLAYGIGREFTPFFLIRLWYGELADYDVLTGYCTPGKPCGHYIQIVWAETKYVGCAVNFCKNLYDPSRDRKIKDTVFLVCNYGPGGNYAGESPYKIGPPCTECSSWSGKCHNGLCSDCDLSLDSCECAIQCFNGGTLNRDSCRCECAAGWTGPQCNTVCNNTHPFCGNGWPQSWCFKDDDDNPVEELCPALCGVCECGGPPCQNGGTKDPVSCTCQCPHTWSGSHCQECNLQCEHGQMNPNDCSCQCDTGWMGDTCSEPCGNSHRLCYNGWYINWCNEEHPYVLDYCKAMCGVCDVQVEVPEPDACEDSFIHCRWSMAYCHSNPDFGQNFCPRTCGFCPTDEETDNTGI